MRGPTTSSSGRHRIPVCRMAEQVHARKNFVSRIRQALTCSETIFWCTLPKPNIILNLAVGYFMFR